MGRDTLAGLAGLGHTRQSPGTMMMTKLKEMMRKRREMSINSCPLTLTLTLTLTVGRWSRCLALSNTPPTPSTVSKHYEQGRKEGPVGSVQRLPCLPAHSSCVFCLSVCLSDTGGKPLTRPINNTRTNHTPPYTHPPAPFDAPGRAWTRARQGVRV